MINNNILSYGITGKFGFKHNKISINFGTKIKCGISNIKNGGLIFHLPIYSSAIKAVKSNNCKISVLFIPYFVCKKIILENIYCGIKIIVCITENISVFDVLKIKYYCNKYKIFFIGPNSPGIILPFLKIRLGIIPINIIKKGNLAIISKSGTLTYEAIKISSKTIGQSICIGIGGDIITGCNIKNILKIVFLNQLTKKILIIGEIGGNIENIISNFKIKKKIYFYIVGVFSPLEKKMGHAGAINKNINDVLIKIKKIKKKHIVLNILDEILFIK
ncbi:succinyl-CoA synthetase subunit alpha [Candidatus Carsonella ruddii]|uniref:Succinyl-CoA synthetase alpha subunit n=1 Tax=Candidatus Carsonella ruddii PC isolate NHV TaxID=1202540 RepID=J3TEQ9_CARRU|nr:succinyl-CoA synthetase subunit alpha [Candidatus Carsonella ruddii]AFP84327.1 succinyl-CoA synthetase alpha subunit [Candidatus Carsonella ruddii PC isolate NHV]